MNIGDTVINSSKDYMHRNIRSINLSIFHPYFNITTDSIIRRVLYILYPYGRIYNTGLELYIPLHSFITFSLLRSIIYNLDIVSKYFIMELISIILVLGVIYFYNIQSISVLDIIALGGYKYMYMVVISGCNMVGRGSLLMFVNALFCIYFMVTLIYFYINVLKSRIIENNRRKKVYVMMIVVLIELLVYFYLLYL